MTESGYIKYNKNSYTLDDFIQKIKTIAQKNNLTEQDLFSAITVELKKVTLFDTAVNGFIFNDVLDRFNPTVQKIYVKDIVNGTRDDLDTTLLGSMATIGRNSVIYNNIDNVNLKSIKESFKTNQSGFFEHNGKVYLGGDGNHRIIEMKFLYEMEKLKVKTKQEQIDLDEKFSFFAPIIQTNHSPELLAAIQNLKFSAKPTKFIDICQKLITENELSIMKYVSYEKESKKYNISYQGIERLGVSEKDAIKILNELAKRQDSYRVFKIGDSYQLEYGNILKLGLSKQQTDENIKQIEESINEKTYSSEYRVVQNENKTYNLFIEYKRVYGDEDYLQKVYSSAVRYYQPKNRYELSEQLTNDQFRVLTKQEINSVFIDNMELADMQINEDSHQGYVVIPARSFENISKEELIDRINLLEKERQFVPMEAYKLNGRFCYDGKYVSNSKNLSDNL